MSKIDIPVPISKIDEDQRIVFGWCSVVEKDGRLVVDLQDEVIPEAVLEKAVYDYVLNSRVGGEMHERKAGRMIESMIFTKEKQQALGIDLGKVGWWVGYKIDETT